MATQALISSCYAVYALSLARRGTNPMFLLKALVFANLGYAILCLVFAAYFFRSATIVGLGYLRAESLFVGLLAFVESRTIHWSPLPKVALGIQ